MVTEVKTAMRYELGAYFTNDRYWWYWRELVPASCTECSGTGDAPAYRPGTEIMVSTIEGACGECGGSGARGWQYASEKIHGGHFSRRIAEDAAKASAEERGMVAVLAR